MNYLSHSQIHCHCEDICLFTSCVKPLNTVHKNTSTFNFHLKNYFKHSKWNHMYKLTKSHIDFIIFPSYNTSRRWTATKITSTTSRMKIKLKKNAYYNKQRESKNCMLHIFQLHSTQLHNISQHCSIYLQHQEGCVTLWWFHNIRES